MQPQPNFSEGATVVITHRVKEKRHSEYENWVERIGAACRASAGCLDWQMVRPIPDISLNYTVIVRFDTADHLRAWMNSAQRRDLILEAEPFLAAEDQYTIHSGLDFWFTPQGAKVKVPVRWKQFFVTWSAIYPLATLVPLVVLPAARALGVGDLRLVTTLITTGVIVALMVYLVMPRYTHLLRRWLYS